MKCCGSGRCRPSCPISRSIRFASARRNAERSASEQEREDAADHCHRTDRYAKESVGQRGEVDVQQYANRRAAEVASGTTEDTDEQEDAQVAPPEDEWVDTQQYVENYISEQISGMTEDTGAGADIDLHIERSMAGMTEETGSGADIGAHIQSRMDEIAHDVTEETGSEGDPHLHVQRRMEEMAKDIFEDDD